jgi:TRAP-type C4-dicarboxylate transport system substrate-binding protein
VAAHRPDGRELGQVPQVPSRSRLLVNLDKWKKLDQKTRDFLQKEAIDYEAQSIKDNEEFAKKEDEELKKRGVQFVAMKPEAGKRFVEEATRQAWDRLKSRDPSNVEALRKAFTK